jgi:hypothetical protein
MMNFTILDASWERWEHVPCSFLLVTRAFLKHSRISFDRASRLGAMPKLDRVVDNIYFDWTELRFVKLALSILRVWEKENK